MRRQIKYILESINGHKIWLEPSSDIHEVRAFISSLVPVRDARPLVRLGNAGDGGYLAPDDLEGVAVAVSPGVSTEVSFDSAMAERGMEVYMVDGSVDGPPVQNQRFHFQKKFLDVFEDKMNMRLDTLCALIRPEHKGDRLLQMDIEGAEYSVLLDASAEVIRSFRIMLIEFHQLDRMFAAFPFRLIKATFQKLKRTHEIVHIHPNNVAQPRIRKGVVIPPVMEFTFYRRDRVVVDPKKELKFPHPLDRDNVPQHPSSPLPECWR